MSASVVALIVLLVLLALSAAAAAIPIWSERRPSARERELARLAWEQQMALWQIQQIVRQGRADMRNATRSQDSGD